MGVRRGLLHPDGGPVSPDGQDHLQLLRGFRLGWRGLLPGIVGGIGFLGGVRGRRPAPRRSPTRPRRPLPLRREVPSSASAGASSAVSSVTPPKRNSSALTTSGEWLSSSRIVIHRISLSDFPIVRRVAQGPALDVAQGLRFPVQVALHGGNAAEDRRFRQLGEVEVADFLFQPVHQAEARSGGGVHFGDIPGPVRVRGEQLGRQRGRYRSRPRARWRRGRGWLSASFSGHQTGVPAYQRAGPATW